MVAQLTRRADQLAEPAAEGGGAEVVALARKTIEAFVDQREIIAPPKDASELFSQRAACFVSIKTKAGELRGCVGTIEPLKDTLGEELIANAISAATRDPRFSPVGKVELPNLKYSVDVLSQPEPARREDLDPHIYGLILEDQRGLRRGLLLPDLAGIDTPAKQIEITSHKAGIKPGEPIVLFRFRVARYSEPS